MNNLMWCVGAAALAVLVAGCRPELAEVEYSPEERSWHNFIRSEYSGYQPPATPPPAVEGSYLAAPTPVVQPVDALPVMEEESESLDIVTLPDDVAADPEAPLAEPLSEEVVGDDGSAAPAVAPKSAVQAAKNTQDAKVGNAAAGETFYTVKAGDTLSLLAKKYYKSASKYDILLKANPQLNNNPKALKPGMKLRIPQM